MINDIVCVPAQFLWFGDSAGVFMPAGIFSAEKM